MTALEPLCNSGIAGMKNANIFFFQSFLKSELIVTN